MADMLKMMAQAKDLQAKMNEVQSDLEDAVIQGTCEDASVTVTLSGRGEMQGVNIDASLLTAEQKNTVEDLIVGAFNDAKLKVEMRMQEEMARVTQGMDLPPGLKAPL